MARGFLSTDEEFYILAAEQCVEEGWPLPVEIASRMDNAGLKVPGANWPKPREE